jgi:TRAP transporter TAXI family solute receptor
MGTPPALTKEYRLSFATGGTAGTYYPYGGAIAALWSKHVKGVTATVEATGGSVENLRRLANKEVEVAFTQNDIADYAYNGTEQFNGQPIKNFRSLGALYPEVLQWVVNPTIKSVADLKGKRFVVGAAGSGTEVNTRQVFDANGMKFTDLGRSVNLSFAEASNAMKDRQVDGYAVTGGVPTSAITDTTTAVDIAILPIDGDVAKKVTDKYKFYVTAKVPANAYKGVTADVNTIAVLSTIVVREDMDADLVYWLTKTLVEQQAELAQSHAKGKELSKDAITQGLTVPLHPGAEKYYREAGILR